MHKKQEIGQNCRSNMKTHDGGLLKDLQLKNMNASFFASICDAPAHLPQLFEGRESRSNS